MKPIVLLLMGFVFSFSVSAQNTLLLNELPKVKLDTILQLDTNKSLSVIPGYKPYSLPNHNFNFNAPGNQFNEYLSKNNLITKRYLKYNYKMPVVGFGGGASRMPFVVPDSAVKFPIKELRIVIIDDDKQPEK